MSGNILLVDDSGFIRFQIKRMLVDEGYSVFEAVKGLNSAKLFRINAKKYAPLLIKRITYILQ